MRYISVFSGIEAATCAWQPLDWEAVAFSEIEPFPCALLAHYYPDVPNLGDISKVEWSKFHGTVDLVVGGSPCQSFSVAGQREGMDGASGLVREYFRLLQEVRPRWFVWENVPGVFSSNKGKDFSFIVSKWHELGYNVSWRILDAQYFGVAQRRRRVFAIGYIGNWRYPAKVLFEPESLRGHSSQSRKKRQAHPGCTQASPSVSGCDLYNGKVTGDIAVTLNAASGSVAGHSGPSVFTPSSFGGYAEGTGTLRASGGDFGGGSEMLIAKTLCAKPGYRLNPDDETLIPAKLPSTPHKHNLYVLDDQGGSQMTVHKDGKTGTLRAETHEHEPIVLESNQNHATITQTGISPTLPAAMGEGGGYVPMIFEPGVMSRDGDQNTYCAPIAPAIGASGPPHSRTGNERTEVEALVCQPTIMKQREGKPGGGKGPLFGDKSFTLACGQDQTLFWQGVRRLTPLEAERLQGFQDGYTDIEFRGKPAADGVRYKALGNSMCVNVMRWIGERIQAVEDGKL